MVLLVTVVSVSRAGWVRTILNLSLSRLSGLGRRRHVVLLDVSFPHMLRLRRAYISSVHVEAFAVDLGGLSTYECSEELTCSDLDVLQKLPRLGQIE